MRDAKYGAPRRAAARRGAAPLRMPSRQRASLYLVLGTLWASGCGWLVLDQFFAGATQFGRTPHPWAGPLLLLHGVLALLGLYLLGWVTARHVLRWWPAGRRRLSGGVLAAFLALLSLSGFALFFLSDDRWQHLAASSHDVLGVAVTVFGVQHWFFARHRDIRSAASRP